MNDNTASPKCSPNRGPISSPAFLLSPNSLESSDLILRSAERKKAFALARDTLVCGIERQTSTLLSSDSPPNQSVEATGVARLAERRALKKKLEFQPAACCSFDLRRVSFGSVDVQSITPRSEKTGAIGLGFEQEDGRVIVRSVNPDGPAAADGRIVPGDVVISGLCSVLEFFVYLMFDSDCFIVNGVPVNGMSVDSLRQDITGDIGTFVQLAVTSCWYVTCGFCRLKCFSLASFVA